MYTILVNQDNTLTTSVKERIMQRSNLVNSLHFLVDTMYKDIDMSDFTVTLEYVLPISKEYKTEILVKSEELYKDKLEYKLPFNTKLTKENGDIKIKLTFIKVDLDADGSDRQYVRKTSETTIHITALSAWSDIIPDEALTPLDQRIIALEAVANQLDELHQESYEEINKKADNINLDVENGKLCLISNGEKIGTPINLNDLGDALSENTKDGLTFVITDDSEEPEPTGYTLKLNKDSNEIYLLFNGKVISTISAQELGESIIDSTKSDGTNVVIV